MLWSKSDRIEWSINHFYFSERWTSDWSLFGNDQCTRDWFLFGNQTAGLCYLNNDKIAFHALRNRKESCPGIRRGSRGFCSRGGEKIELISTVVKTVLKPTRLSSASLAINPNTSRTTVRSDGMKKEKKTWMTRKIITLTRAALLLAAFHHIYVWSQNNQIIGMQWSWSSEHNRRDITARS